MDLNHGTYFLRSKCLGNVSNTDFVQEFAFYCTVQFVPTEKLAHISTKGPVRKQDQVVRPTKFDLIEYNGYLQRISTFCPYPDISPRGSWLPIMGVSETLDSKWLIPIFFDNLIMQRIRKGRQSGWKLRKMRKGWIGAGSRRKLRWETND